MGWMGKLESRLGTARIGGAVSATIDVGGRSRALNMNNMRSYLRQQGGQMAKEQAFGKKTLGRMMTGIGRTSNLGIVGGVGGALGAGYIGGVMNNGASGLTGMNGTNMMGMAGGIGALGAMGMFRGRV